MKKITFAILIMVATISCGDEYIQYQASIDNQTNDTIKIFFTGNTAYIQGASTFIYLPHINTVYSDLEGRKRKNIICDPQINLEEVEVVVSSGKTLKKNIGDANNWKCNTTKERHIMTFIITEDDLE